MTEIATFPTAIEPLGLVTRIVDTIRAAYARRCDRLAYNDLLSRDDETFSDICLTRSDVRRARNHR